jgi:hypothetical protein
MRLHGRTGMVAGSITSVLVVGLALMASLLIAPIARAQASGDAKPAAGREEGFISGYNHFIYNILQTDSL